MILKHPRVEMERVWMLGAEERVGELKQGGAQLVSPMYHQGPVVHGLVEHWLRPSMEQAAGTSRGNVREATHQMG